MATRRELLKLAALSAGDGTAQRFGVAGIFVGCGGELIIFLAGQNHDVVALWAFGHHGHVGFSLVVNPAATDP